MCGIRCYKATYIASPLAACVVVPAFWSKWFVNLIISNNTFLLADDWKSDQIRWINDAVHLLPKWNPVFRKQYYIYSRHREWSFTRF